MPDKSDSTAPIIEVVENYINIPQNDISVNKAMDDEYVNLVKSVYPLDNFALIIQEYAIKGKLIIINKNKADKMLAPIGIQPSQRSRIISLARDTIAQTNKDVNAYDVQELRKNRSQSVPPAVENGLQWGSASDNSISQNDTFVNEKDVCYM